MGYRNETEHLRARVEQLEGQLAAIRGQRRRGREETFARRLRRQQWILVGLAVVASGGALLCLVPTIGITLDNPTVTREALATASDETLPPRVQVPLTVDLHAVTELESGLGQFAPALGEPRILVRCEWSTCPEALETRMEDAAYGYPVTPRERVLGGRVHVVGPDGHAPGFAAGELSRYASQRGLSVDELRVLTPTAAGDPVTPLWVMMGMVAFAAVLAWLAVGLHLWRGRAEVALPTDADFVPTDPTMVVILGLVTCRLYELFWLYRSTARLRRVTGRPDLMPEVDVVLTLATFGLWSLWAYFRNAEAVDEALAEVGPPTTYRASVVGLSLATFMCGLVHWVLVYQLQQAYNRVLEASDAGAEPGGDGLGPGGA